MKRNCRALFASLMPCVVLVFGSGTMEAAMTGCKIAAPLDAEVEQFHARNLPLIEALIQFGQENQICLGIEGLDEDLLKLRADFDVFNATAREVILRILGVSSFLEAAEQDGVILIRPRTPPAKQWLDFVIPLFASSRGTVPFTNAMLYFTFAATLDPSIRGFGGSFASGDQTDIIGPLHEDNRTIRTNLNRIITSSKGAMWVAYGSLEVQPEAPKKPFWIILQYSAERDSLFSLINGLAPTPRPAP